MSDHQETNGTSAGRAGSSASFAEDLARTGYCEVLCSTRNPISGCASCSIVDGPRRRAHSPIGVKRLLREDHHTY
jgi:hypothetical protein